MATYDLSDYLEDGTVVLEGIRSEKFADGKAYRFASPSAKVGLWLQHLVEFGIRANLAGGQVVSQAEVGKLVLDDDEERDLYQRVMGATLEEMLTDGVPWSSVQKVFKLLLQHWGANRDIGAQIAAGRPEAQGPVNRAERRAQQKTAGSRSSRASTGTPARTRSRTSTRSSGTSGTGREAATA